MGLRVDGRLPGQKQVNSQWNVITIGDLKRCLPNARIDSRIDSYFCYSHIVRPVLLGFIKQIYSKDLTNNAIHIFCLTIKLRMVS